MEELIAAIAPNMDTQSVSLLSVGLAVSLGAKVIGKVIPDDKKGVLGVIRSAAKIIGLVVEDRKVSKKNQTEMLPSDDDEDFPSALQQEVIRAAAKKIFKRDPKTGRLVPTKEK